MTSSIKIISRKAQDLVASGLLQQRYVTMSHIRVSERCLLDEVPWVWCMGWWLCVCFQSKKHKPPSNPDGEHYGLGELISKAINAIVSPLIYHLLSVYVQMLVMCVSPDVSSLHISLVSLFIYIKCMDIASKSMPYI